MDMAFGDRDKVFLGIGEILGISGGFAWSKVGGGYVFATSISGGAGLCPFLLSPGYNHGTITPID